MLYVTGMFGMLLHTCSILFIPTRESVLQATQKGQDDGPYLATLLTGKTTNYIPIFNFSLKFALVRDYESRCVPCVCAGFLCGSESFSPRPVCLKSPQKTGLG